MGFLALIKYGMKWTLTTLTIGSLTYALHDDISKLIHRVEFYNAKAEPSFVPKEQAFDLTFIYEKNGRANLETEVKNYTQLLPVYSREHGIMVGSAAYNFSNFNSGERSKACSKKIARKE